MPNGLTDLITKYESTLKVEDWKAIPYENLREFEADLIKKKNYRYGAKDMEETYLFLESKKITLYGRYNALEMIIRRKIMDGIKDFEKRKGLWMAIDTGLTPRHSTSVFLVYAARYGNEQAEKDVREMIESYEKKVHPQILILKGKLNEEKDPERKKILDETYENHVQITNCVVNWTLPYFLEALGKTKETHKSAEAQL
ncbi:MAG: hypothetical protein V1645_04195 [archaeon]